MLRRTAFIRGAISDRRICGYASFISTPKGDAIDVAAKELSEAAYPFLKEIDWKSDLYLQPLPGVTTKQVLKAVDKTIFMGSKIGANELKAGGDANQRLLTGQIGRTSVQFNVNLSKSSCIICA